MFVNCNIASVSNTPKSNKPIVFIKLIFSNGGKKPASVGLTAPMQLSIWLINKGLTIAKEAKVKVNVMAKKNNFL